MDTHELAWSAGFFDGEGNIRLKRVGWRDRSYFYPVLFIPQIDRQVLDRFKNAVGGLGKVSGPHTSSQRDGVRRQPQWYYEAYKRKDVREIMSLLRPYLSPVKVAQANDVFTRDDAAKQTDVVVTDTTSGISYP